LLAAEPLPSGEIEGGRGFRVGEEAGPVDEVEGEVGNVVFAKVIVESLSLQGGGEGA
jgi:hypothetical protein